MAFTSLSIKLIIPTIVARYYFILTNPNHVAGDHFILTMLHNDLRAFINQISNPNQCSKRLFYPNHVVQWPSLSLSIKLLIATIVARYYFILTMLLNGLHVITS